MSIGSNATLFVPEFSATTVAGEFTFVGATYNNQSDFSGAGAYVVEVGNILYVPSIDLNTGIIIPGRLRRYTLSSVTIDNQATISGTMIWDENGSPDDTPANGVYCVISSASPNLRLGYPVSDQLYPELAVGSSVAAITSDMYNVIDSVVSALRPPDSTTYTYTADGNVDSSLEQIGTNQRISSYVYDTEGNVVSISESFMGINKVVTLAYDTNGNVSSITSTIV
ncbi:hypothetical protein UFOVP116_8 [uncultured Caudovirales phage]|uniref:Uncharacterized protein n=1 Tax=uncultured Caudovirales phage TaxID=2100421 RepID=A0A6J5LCK2_9CAUD|nr:hypothetical protein UFOVP116_8 [uncultured Caudovirales phage]